MPDVDVQAEPTPWRARASQSVGNALPKANNSVERNIMTNPENIGIV